MSDLQAQFTRRSAMTATIAVAGTGMLAACGGGDDEASTKPVDATIDASKVSVGSGFVDRGNSIVVTQPTKGTFKAFTSVCPHQGCQVGEFTDKAIVCPCHGSRFDPMTGAVLAGPADKPLAEKKVEVKGSQLHVTG